MLDNAINGFGSGNQEMAAMMEAANATSEPTTEPTDTPTEAPNQKDTDSSTPSEVVQGVPHLLYIFSLVAVALLSVLITLLVMRTKKSDMKKLKKK